MVVLSRDLSLRFRNFFDEDPGHWTPACVGVMMSNVWGTVTNPESYAHLAFVDVVTVTLNMAGTVIILTVSFTHVHNTVNWQGSWTFCTVESEIPAFATTVTALDSKIASPGNMEGCVREVLSKYTVLKKQNKTKYRDFNHLVILSRCAFKSC